MLWSNKPSGKFKGPIYLILCEMENNKSKNTIYSPGAKTHGSPIIIWQIWSNLTSLHVQVFKYVDFAYYLKVGMSWTYIEMNVFTLTLTMQMIMIQIYASIFLVAT